MISLPCNAFTKRHKQRKGYNLMRDMELKDELVLAHRGLGSWSAVVALCGDNPKTGRPYSPTMAWWWASGQRAIPDHVTDAWFANVTRAMLKSWLPRQRKERVSIEVRPEVAQALRNTIKKPGDTWNDAFLRLLADNEPGSAPHLFTMLTKHTLCCIVFDLESTKTDPNWYSTDAEWRAIEWLLDRAELELSMRQQPDWARKE